MSMSADEMQAYDQQFEAYLKDPDAPRILVQFCIPWQIEQFDVRTIDTTGVPDDIADDVWPLVRRVRAGEPLTTQELPRKLESIRERRDPRSGAPVTYGSDHISKRFATSAHLTLWDATEAGQAVYQFYTRDREGDFVAVSLVREARQDPGRVLQTYWFKPPSKIPAGSFTNWLQPVSEESPEEAQKNNTWWHLANGRSMHINKVEPGAPMARYSKVSYREYPKVEAPQRRATGLGFLAMVKADPVGTEDRIPQDRFLPGASARISRCQ